MIPNTAKISANDHKIVLAHLPLFRKRCCIKSQKTAVRISRNKHHANHLTSCNLKQYITRTLNNQSFWNFHRLKSDGRMRGSVQYEQFAVSLPNSFTSAQPPECPARPDALIGSSSWRTSDTATRFSYSHPFPQAPCFPHRSLKRPTRSQRRFRR